MSNITAVVEPNKRSLVVVCHGLNMQLTENVVSTHTVNILCKLMNENNKFLINCLRVAFCVSPNEINDLLGDRKID